MYTNVCKHCRKTFKSRLKAYSCEDCKQKDNDVFDDIEAYLQEYPNSNALQISEALGISAFKVLYYLKEGRLNISTGRFERLDNNRDGE